MFLVVIKFSVYLTLLNYERTNSVFESILVYNNNVKNLQGELKVETCNLKRGSIQILFKVALNVKMAMHTT